MQLFSLSCIFILDDNGDNLYNHAVVLVVIVVVYFLGTTTATTYTTMQLFPLL